ncbi:MAG: LysR family transcriptional regulator [Pseudomonadota bacterium]
MAVAPPRPKDLALNALRAFEAAARLGGFAAAAVELGVSPGAITSHIKALEAALGAPLFVRTPRGVVPTPLGARAASGFTDAFDGLAQAVQALRADAAPQVVHIATLPAIAQLWLSPRLPGLRVVAPEISVSITALEAPPNLKRAPYDLCLFYADKGGASLCDDVIFPVCTPGVAAALRHPADLATVPCLGDSAWGEDWAIWSAVAMPGGLPVRGPVYSLYALAVEEALNGAGVAIGHEALVARHLTSGALVAPFDLAVTLPRALRLWSARPARPRGAVDRVVQFLRGR